jgi:hypothetical protein
MNAAKMCPYSGFGAPSIVSAGVHIKTKMNMEAS